MILDCGNPAPGSGESLRDLLVPLCRGAFNVNVYATWHATPHIDAVTGDYTVGLALDGDHLLFTGNGRPVGNLLPGSVYLLHNKTQHGVKPRTPDSDVLRFIALDFHADSIAHALDCCIGNSLSRHVLPLGARILHADTARD